MEIAGCCDVDGVLILLGYAVYVVSCLKMIWDGVLVGPFSRIKQLKISLKILLIDKGTR